MIDPVLESKALAQLTQGSSQLTPVPNYESVVVQTSVQTPAFSPEMHLITGLRRPPTAKKLPQLAWAERVYFRENLLSPGNHFDVHDSRNRDRKSKEQELRLCVRAYVHLLWVIGEFPFGGPRTAWMPSLVSDERRRLFDSAGDDARVCDLKLGQRPGLLITFWGDRGEDVLDQLGARDKLQVVTTRAGVPFRYTLLVP